MIEARITDEQVFLKGNNPLKNPFYGYNKREVALPDGKTGVFHGIELPDSVHVVAVDDDLDTYFVLQPRPSNARHDEGMVIPRVLELPGGGVTAGKTIVESGLDELEEEAGVTAGRVEQIGSLRPSPLFSALDHILLGREIQARAQAIAHRDASEAGMEIVKIPFGKAYDEVRRGDMPVASQMLAALALAEKHL